MAFPDFLCIGAQKCGTTWLYQMLRTQEGVWVPPVKELHYFDELLDGNMSQRKGAVSKRTARRERQLRQARKRLVVDPSGHDLLFLKRFLSGDPNHAWYATLFPEKPGLVVGEITPDYASLNRAVVADIAAANPSLKVLYFIRNPIDRSWSNVQMSVRASEPQMTSEQIRAELQGPRPRALSDYHTTLSLWSEYFPPEQIFLGYLDDVSIAPGRVLEAVGQFLGVGAITWKGARRRVHQGESTSIPREYWNLLAEQHMDEIAVLSKMYGGPAHTWRFMTRQYFDTISNLDEVGYPVWDYPLWEDLSEHYRFGSGSLDSIQKRQGLV